LVSALFDVYKRICEEQYTPSGEFISAASATKGGNRKHPKILRAD